MFSYVNVKIAELDGRKQELLAKIAEFRFSEHEKLLIDKQALSLQEKRAPGIGRDPLSMI